MTDRRFQPSMKMAFIVAPPSPPHEAKRRLRGGLGSAPLRSPPQKAKSRLFGDPGPAAARSLSFPAYPALTRHHAARDSVTRWANLCRAYGALPQQPKSGVAGGPGADASQVIARRTSGSIFE